VEERREFLISRGWVQAVLLVVLFGFFVLGLLAYRTYQAKPPIPERVVDPQGRTVYTGSDIRRGQKTFLNHGLMEYGSAFGHGAYLGPDFTADYLQRSSDFVRSRYGGPRSDRAGRRTVEDFRTNRYDKRTGVLALTAPQAEAHRRLVVHYTRFFSEPTTKHGLESDAITARRQLAQLTAFFGWTAWAASASGRAVACARPARPSGQLPAGAPVTPPAPGRERHRPARATGRGSAIELLELLPVAVVDDVALELERRRELAFLLRQVVVE
jgi:nitric oxide reductase large subunit